MFDWTGPRGDRFSLSVTGYQFPAANDGHDANWLVVSIQARNHSGAWTATAPCVLTWDLLSLADWLRDVETDEAEAWCGLEVDVILTSLGWSRGHATVAVALSYGLSKPDLAEEVERARDLLVVDVIPAHLTQSILGVQRACEAFPPRGVVGLRTVAAWKARRRATLLARADEDPQRSQS